MFKNIFRTVLVLSIIGLIGSANVLAAAPETLTGRFLIGDKWLKGTLTAEKIERTTDDLGNTTVKGTGEWKFEAIDGGYTVSGGKLFQTLFEESKGGDSGDDLPQKGNGKIISTNDGLSITSDELLDIEIYDLSGRVVYIATDINNLSIDRSTLNLINGTYMLRSVNKEGKEERVIFILTE